MQGRVFMEKFRNWFWLILRLFRIPGGHGKPAEILVGKSNGSHHSVWEAPWSENMGCDSCDLRRCNFSCLFSLFNIIICNCVYIIAGRYVLALNIFPKNCHGCTPGWNLVDIFSLYDHSGVFCVWLKAQSNNSSTKVMTSARGWDHFTS